MYSKIYPQYLLNKASPKALSLIHASSQLRAQLSPRTLLRQEISTELLSDRGIELSVLRLDLLDEIGSGNKHFKLIQHLHFIEQNQPGFVISFGGAYSNHLHALAYACKDLNTQFVACVRGELVNRDNQCIADMRHWGAQIHYLKHADYRQRNNPTFLAQLKNQYQNAYIIAEGASDLEGLMGAELLGFYLAEQFYQQQLQSNGKNSPQYSNEYDFDILALACGTAATFCGLLSGFAEFSKLMQHASSSAYQAHLGSQAPFSSNHNATNLAKTILGMPVLNPKHLARQLLEGLLQIYTGLPVLGDATSISSHRHMLQRYAAEVLNSDLKYESCFAKHEFENTLLTHLSASSQRIMTDNTKQQVFERTRLFPEWQLDRHAYYPKYAHISKEQNVFAKQMLELGLPLDPIYTSKVLYRIFNKIEQGLIPKDARLLVLHTGGLQGVRGIADWPVDYLTAH